MSINNLDNHRTNFRHGGVVKKDKKDEKRVLIAQGEIHVTEETLEHLGYDLIRKINNASEDTPVITHKFVQEKK